jgi:hypothetical protein
VKKDLSVKQAKEEDVQKPKQIHEREQNDLVNEHSTEELEQECMVLRDIL